MIEIYLFVNPLGEYCFKMEQQLLQFIEEEYGTPSKEKMQFRFLPLVNLQTIGDVMQQKGISQNNLEKRNHLFCRIRLQSGSIPRKEKRPPFFDQTARSSRLQ